MSDVVMRTCGHTERMRLPLGLNSKQYMKAINALLAFSLFAFSLYCSIIIYYNILTIVRIL